MRIIKKLFWILLLGISIVSIIPHLFPHYWLADIFSHFKFQYVVFLLILLPAAVFLFKKKIFPVIIALLLLAWNSWFVIPLYLDKSLEIPLAGDHLSMLSMNLLASNNDYAKAIKLIEEKNPDLVILLELSPEWEQQLEVLLMDYPFRKLVPQKNNFGIGILSKKPLETEVIYFQKDFPPSLLNKLEVNGKSISILATHPVPPVSQAMFDFRNEQLQEIREFSRIQPGNFIVVGDLNTSSYSKHFEALLAKGELRDSRKGFGIASTWPTHFHIMRTTLDHFLLKGPMKVLERTTETDIGSDHLPIYLKLKL